MRRISSLFVATALLASVGRAAGDRLIHIGSNSPGAISVFQTGPVYSLRFVGDETIEYQIDVSDPMVAAGVLRVHEVSSDSYPIYLGGPGFRFNGIGEGTPDYLANWSYLANESMTPNSVILDYTDVREGEHHRRHEFTIHGKSLRIRVRDLDENLRYESNYCGLVVGPMEGVEEWRYLPIQGALATPTIYFRNGTEHFFAANLLDLYVSSASDWGLVQEPEPGESNSSVRYNMHTFNRYYRTSGRIGPRAAEPRDGSAPGTAETYGTARDQRLAKPLDDTVNITVSRFLVDVLATPTQPASPYRDLLTGRTVMLLDGTSWTQYSTLLDLYASWGLDQLAAYFWTSWSDSEIEWPLSYNAGPDWYPARDEANFASMIATARSQGMLCGAYMTFNDMPPTAPPSVYQQSHIARYADLTYKLNMFTGFPLIATTAAGIHARREAELAKTHYGFNLAYLDINTVTPPASSPEGDHIDQREGSLWAQSVGEGIEHQKRWMHDMQEIFEGPLLGEGSGASIHTNLEWVWIGACDSVQRNVNTGGGGWPPQIPVGDPLAPTNWPVIPEFEWRVMARLQANHGNAFADRFFGPSDGASIVDMTDGTPIFPFTEAAWDRYRLYEITYGKTAFVMSTGPYNGAGNYARYAGMIKEHYMMNELQSLYFAAPVSTIQYLFDGSLMSFEEIMSVTENGSSFRDPKIKLQFANGLEIYLNHNPSPWLVSADGIDYTIPEDGFLAYVPSTRFIAFSAIAPTTNGQRIDYCYAPGRYEFFDGRGAVASYGGIDTRQSSGPYASADSRGAVTRHGGTETRGVKRLRLKNFVYNRFVWETESGEILTAQAPGPVPQPVHVDILPLQEHPIVGGQRLALRAIATFDNGAIQNVTSLVHWSSSDPAVAKVDDGAALMALIEGEATITVTPFRGASVTPLVVTVQ